MTDVLRPRLAAAAVAAGLMAALTGAVSAQSVEVVERSTPGWVFTPTVSLGAAFDSNPVLTVEGDASPDDVLTTARPGLELSFNGRHTNASGAYRGSLLRYRTLQEYDSFDQGGYFQLRHQASRRVGLFTRGSLVISPATDILELSGVPFFRAGTRHTSAEAGTSVALSRHLDLSAAYQFQAADFDAVDPEIAALLLGGSAHGVTFGVTRQTSARVKVGGSYGYQRASYGTAEGGFNVQNAEATVSWKLRPTVDLDAGFGISRLTLPDTGDVRTGPAGRVSLRKQTSYALWSLNASRSFVPAFGFGGSMVNKELTGSVQVPLARRLHLRGAVSVRGSEPVLAQELGLTSVWLQSSVGYALRRWARIETYYSGTFQDTSAVGGRVDRHRLGVQFSTSVPMRIQP